MRRFSKRFRTPRPSLCGESPRRQSPTTHEDDGPHHAPTDRTPPPSAETGNTTTETPLDTIAHDLGNISRRVEDLKGLVNAHRSTVAQVAEIKYGLRETHRVVEQLQAKRCRALGGEFEALAQEVMRFSWQSYKSAVLLEEKLKMLGSDGVQAEKEVQESDGLGAMRSKGKAAGVYIPTGALQRAGSMRRESYRNLRTSSRFEPFVEDGTKAGVLRSNCSMASITSDSTTSTVRGTRSFIRRTSFSSVSSGSESSRTATVPQQSKVDVKRRIHQEEINWKFALNEADTIRQGSCDGSSIAAMVMSGFQDDGLVLPNLHYIKVHELRALIEWMTETQAVTGSESMSCVEKVLHCVQLLQSGCRYESLAVIFSRSPRQIKMSCLQVMGGLLRLHGETVNKTAGQEMYMPLWKIWRKFEATEGRAGAYYGFRWMEVAKVLVTLNLYIGRWRMQGMFATDGPTFLWGRFFVSPSGTGTSSQGAKRVATLAVEAADGKTVADDDGASPPQAVQKEGA
ncbi:hypothetical protein NX059_009502 [Plenodomus lindquistii]|nr:hypothetical protein NX059_009502 [Plenodomus lindquistii]